VPATRRFRGRKNSRADTLITAITKKKYHRAVATRSFRAICAIRIIVRRARTKRERPVLVVAGERREGDGNIHVYIYIMDYFITFSHEMLLAENHSRN